MGTYRIEHDSMGNINVPTTALYGIQTQRAVLNFPISGLRPWRAFIWSLAVIKLNAAKVNSELGLLKPGIKDVIIQAAQEVMDGKWDDQFVVDPFQAGAGTSHNMNANEVIANRATQLMGGGLGEYLVHPNDHVNMSQSTNDVIPTAIRLGCLWRLEELLNVLENLSKSFYQKAVEFDDILKSGRTHLQDAVPVRLGQEFGAYACAVERDRDRIVRAADGLRRLGIGGTATGTGLNAPTGYSSLMIEYLSKQTGLDLNLSENLFESMQSMADMIDFSSSIRNASLTLTRIANDLRLMASGPTTGLDEIRLPPVQPGSSIMPGKVNPVMAEMLNMAMFHIIGSDTTISMAAQAGQLELNVMMPIIAHSLFEMMQVMIGSVNAFTTKCVVGIEANREKAEGWLGRNAIIVTVLNPILGYEAGADLVKEAMLRNVSIKEIAAEKASRGELFHRGTQTPITKEEILIALSNLHRMTNGGIIGDSVSG